MSRRAEHAAARTPSLAGATPSRSLNGVTLATRSARDPRPVGDRHYASQCARIVTDFLAQRNFGKTMSHEKFLRDPSTKDYYDVFKFLMAHIDEALKIDGKMEDEVPQIMKKLRYPVEVNKSKLQAISGPNTWPQLLAVLEWLVTLIRINEEGVGPLASCAAGLTLIEHDGGTIIGLDFQEENSAGEPPEHLVRKSYLESYTQYLEGYDDQGEARLHEMFDVKSNIVQQEIERLEEQNVQMEKQLHEFRTEHDRLLELQSAPRHAEIEVDRLRGILQAHDQKTEAYEEDMVTAESEDIALAHEIESLKEQLRDLDIQVRSQEYSKKDVDRYRHEEEHLSCQKDELRSELEKLEHDIWELGLKESSESQCCKRTVREANEAIELNEVTLQKDLHLNVDFDVPADANNTVESQSSVLRELRTSTEAERQKLDAELQEVRQAVQSANDEKVEVERKESMLAARVEQLQKARTGHQDNYKAAIDEAQRAAESAEDAVHAVESAPAGVRDAAGIDELRLEIATFKTQAADELARAQEQLRRDEERALARKQATVAEAEASFQDMEALYANTMSELRDLRAPWATPPRLSRGGA